MGSGPAAADADCISTSEFLKRRSTSLPRGGQGHKYRCQGEIPGWLLHNAARENARLTKAALRAKSSSPKKSLLTLGENFSLCAICELGTGGIQAQKSGRSHSPYGSTRDRENGRLRQIIFSLWCDLAPSHKHADQFTH